MSPAVVLVARTPTVADLVEQCARGDLPFSGPDSLYSKVHAMGYACTSLYEAVMAARADLTTPEGK
jgi:hypothetical protein